VAQRCNNNYADVNKDGSIYAIKATLKNMKHNVESISKTDISKILNEYQLGSIREIIPIATSGNSSFLISTSSNRYFMRICPDGNRWRSREEIASELELIEYLRKNRFPAPLPTRKRSGDLIIECKNKFGYLRKYDPGQAVSNPHSKQVEKFGKILGWFHDIIEGYRTKNRRSHFWDPKTTKKNFLENKNFILSSDFPKAEEFVNCLEKEFLSINFADELPRGMIHEDLGRRHILWQNDEISCVIDFDRTYFGKLTLDLGQAARGWCLNENGKEWNREHLVCLLKGYSRSRILTDAEKRNLFDAIKFAVLERALSFCLKSILMGKSKEDAEYALRSVSKDKAGILGMLDQNKEEIDKAIAQIK